MINDRGTYLFIQDPQSEDTSKGRYVFTIPSSPRKPVTIDSEEIDILTAMYSNEGGKGTVHDCAVELGWPDQTVVDILRALRHTHNCLPYTDEKFNSMSEEDVISDLTRQKEQRVRLATKKRSWVKTEESAAKWDAFEANAKTLMQHLNTRPAVKLPPKPPHDLLARTFDLVTHATDLHYGKKGYKDETGKEQNLATTRENLIFTTRKLIATAKRYGGTSGTAYVGVGGDWLHIDNHKGTTTKGTPQDFDGPFMRIYKGACALAEEQIEMFRAAFPRVVVVPVRGNHDEYSSAQLIHWLQAIYRHAPDVEVGEPCASRVYHKSFDTLVAFTHGDSTPNTRLRSLMPNEAPELWGKTKHRLWITGHLHSQMQDEDFGITCEKFNSLASSDYWHNKKGYTGNQNALQGIVITNDGPIAKLTARTAG